MSQPQILIQANGPLPITCKFMPTGDGPVTFVVSGSVWTQTAGSLIGVTLTLDGAVIGNSMSILANMSGDHVAFPTTYINVDSLTYETHVLEVSGANGDTIGDQNDFFQVVLYP